MAKVTEVEGKAVNHGEINKIVAAKTGYSQNIVSAVTSEFVNVISDNIVDGKDVVVRNLISFNTIDKGPCKGRNPRTGEEIDVPAKNVVKAKVSKSLQKKVNPEK